MSLLCDPNTLHLFVEDDLGSFFHNLEKEQKSTSYTVILTDRGTFLNEQPTLLATLKFFLHDPRENSKGNLSPPKHLYTPLQGKLQKCQHRINSPIFNVEGKKWKNRFVFPCSDGEGPLSENLTHSSIKKSTNQDEEKNYERVRRKIRSVNKSAHQELLCKAQQDRQLLADNDSGEMKEIFAKYEQSLVGEFIPTPHLFAHQIKNVLVIISNIQKWDDKVEVAHQLIDLVDRKVTLKQAQIICFANEHILESFYHVCRVLCKGLKVHLFPVSGRALVEVVGDAAGSFLGWHRGEQTDDAVKVDRHDEAVHTDHQNVISTYQYKSSCANSVTHVCRGLLTSLREEDCKGIFTQALKLAMLNDPKLFANINSTDLNQFKKRIKYFLHRLLINSCKIHRKGKRNKKIMNMFRFGNTIGNAIKNAKGNPLNGVFTNEEIFLCYGIYYELRMLYEVDAVDLIFLTEVKEIMMKYKMKYKLSNNYLNYYTHEIIHHLRKGHQSGTDSILLVHLTGIGEVHPDVMISVPLCVVCRILCPMVCFPPRSIHSSLKGTEPTNRWEPFLHIGHVGNKSEAIRVIYVSCMSRENICIRNVTPCVDVVVFVKILRELNFYISLTRQGVSTTYPEDDLSPKEIFLHIKGNIQRSVFLFKRFIYQRGITLHVYNCGTVCRFILPLLCLYICKQNLKAKKTKKRVLKWILLKGSKQMETTRIISPLVQVLRQAFKCVNIEYTKKENYLPICISVKEGANLEEKLFCTEYVQIDNYHSSQFVSSMLLLSAFSQTNTCIGLSFKRVGGAQCGGSISLCDGREESPRHKAAKRKVPSSRSTKANTTTAYGTQRRERTIHYGMNNSPPYGTTKGEATTQQFSTTSKSFIDLTIRVMKLWGVKVGMKNFCYVLKKGSRYPSYGRRRSKLTILKSLVSRVKRFICAVKGVNRWRLLPAGSTKQRVTKCGAEEGEFVNSQVRLPVDVKGGEDDMYISRSSRTPIYTANCTLSYVVQNDLGLLMYFIIGCLIRGENCAIDVGLCLDGVDLYPDQGAEVKREVSGQGEPISHASHDSGDGRTLHSPPLRRIKAIRHQANIPNYTLLNVLLLLGVDIYIEEEGSHKKSKKLYMLTSKRMSIRQEWIKGLLLRGGATSKQRNKDPGVGRVKQDKWEIFQNVHLKMKLYSNKMLLKVIVDVENFSDDFFSLSVLFCYYLLVHPTEFFSFKIKNVRNQNIKESVRVYNCVIILKLFFQNVLSIFCDKNCVYIGRMRHPVENCLFYRMTKKGELPSPGESPSSAASPTAAQIENNSMYVTSDNGGEVYLYVDTQRDHRIIFMVTILALLGGNVLIDNTGEVEKSFPHFFHYAHRYLGLKVNYTTCGELNFCNFTKLCRYELGGRGTASRLEEALVEEPPLENRCPSEVSVTWSDSSTSTNIHHGSTKAKNPPHGSQVKCIQNHQQRGANNMAIQMGEAEKGENFHLNVQIKPMLKESRGGDETKFTTHGQVEDSPSSGYGSTNSSSHVKKKYLCEEEDSVGSPMEGITFSERSTVEGEEDAKGDKSKVTGEYEGSRGGGTPVGDGGVSIATKQNESKCQGRQKGEQNMLTPPGEKQPLKDTCRETCDERVTHGRRAGAVLPPDPNYCREYQYEELLHGNDADILHLINQVNNLNISIICGIRNVGKSYLSKRIKNCSLVIDLDEYILHGPIRFDRLTIGDFRYYEYITFVSMLYVAYLSFAGENCHHDIGEMNGEEAQPMFCENPFLTLREDVRFYNNKVNHLYHTMKEKHFLKENQVPVQSITIVLGGGIVEFERSRHVMSRVKNLLLIKRPPREIYHMCINDKVKPPLSGNLEEIINRRTILFANLNAFHFSIPPEEDIDRCLANAGKSRNELIVSSFLNFFNYKFFVKRPMKHTYSQVASSGETILSLRLTQFYSFDYASLEGTYEVVELVMDCWPNGSEHSGENVHSGETEHKTNLLELAIFTIRSYTDKPICVKFPKWLLDPNFCEPTNERSPGGQKKISYRYTPTDLYKYKINIFDVDINFFKKVKNFMPRKRENIFLIISSYRERVHKGRVTTDLYKLEKSHADLIWLTFARATQPDRETLHVEITRHCEKRLGSPPISHVRGIIRRAPCHNVPPDQVATEQRYEISAYTCEMNDPLVFLCNDVSHVGCVQPGLATQEETRRRPAHPESYMHSFYHQRVKTIISCVPR
ncbi:hypothetical protein AK88_01362 [Plasmodium fragile]|uniref:Enolpyruvate transferase domain-containing protein n=1 Tax=Plasmodium fragile TaxID=5857 RepID=A0A0D9QPU7_PLAFR|nr:uncharacterized protein AK88_01362 [Plasmodium fragile]KJP89069.1 hypothetical protein AK88_01362 [Plasmodium fragile]